MSHATRCNLPWRQLTAAAAILTALAAGAAPCDAARICEACVQANNDTSFTPGTVAIGHVLTLPPNPVVGFVGIDGLLRCALPAAPGWQTEIVDPVAMAGGCAVALDDVGEPMLSYHDSNGMLFLAQRLAGAWIHDVIDATGRVGGVTSMVRTPGGVAIAYEDTVNSTLWFAERRAGGGWRIEPVTPAVEDAAGPSLVVDGLVKAIAYYDPTHGDLRLAVSGGGASWTTSFVDEAGDVGRYASLVGGPSFGGFGIAYYDYSNADLRYAYGDMAGWVIETIDGAGSAVGRFASATLFGMTPADHVGIAYYDEIAGDLKFALKRDVWTTSVQDSAGDVGASVVCAASGVPYDTVGIAYVDRGTHDLLYQWHAGTVTAVPVQVPAAALHIQWLQPAGEKEGRVRFTVPLAGRVRVAFYDASGRTIAVPLSRELPAGATEVRWDGRDLCGHAVRSGVFFVRVDTPGGSGSIPAIVLH